MKIDKFEGEYRWLSNFWEEPVSFNGDSYPSVEHAFQAAKTQDENLRKLVRDASTPSAAKRAGRRVPLRKDWEDVKIGVMLEILRNKFSAPRLQKKLLATGDAELIEGNWWHDVFWGVCNGHGENNLGKLLMKVRDEIREGNE